MTYVTYVCTGGPHEPRVPHPDCANAASHTPSPEGYAAASDWAAAMVKTHTQQKCPQCGYWVIWTKREAVTQ